MTNRSIFMTPSIDHASVQQPESTSKMQGDQVLCVKDKYVPRTIKEYAIVTALGWMPAPLGFRIRQFSYEFIFAQLGKNSRISEGVRLIGAPFIAIGHGVEIRHNVMITANSPGALVKLGDGVMLDHGVDIRVVPGYENCQISIGNATYIGPYTTMGGPGNITIGENCMIASHGAICANNHVFEDPYTPIEQQGVIRRGIVIENDCWLGAGVKVLDGVRIGKGSVVGAGAVVTKSLPAYSIAVGVPARCVRNRLDDASVSN